MLVQHVRFKPDPMEHALLDLRAQPGVFAPSCSALILNESFSGCALILQSLDTILPEKEIRVKVGKLDPLRAQIVWAQPLDKDIYKIGIQFLE